MMQALLVLILFVACAAQQFDFDELMAKLDDVDCTNQTGLKPVGFLLATYKDCIYVACDSGNPDPRLRKYPRACGNKFQTGVNLNTPGGPLYWPASCALYGLTVEECIATSTEICRVEVSTTDDINCGPTYEDLKESSTLPQDVPPVVERKHAYCIFNDPHTMNPIYNNDTRLCARPKFESGYNYKIFHRHPLSVSDYVEIDGSFGAGGGHYLTALVINTAYSILTITVDINGVLTVQEVLKNPTGAGFPTVTWSQPSARVVVVNVVFVTDAEGGRITIVIRGSPPGKMNVCINDHLNVAEIAAFGTSMLDETSYFGYLDSLEGIILMIYYPDGQSPVHLLKDVNSVTYDVDTPMDYHKIVVQEAVNISCWHVVDTPQLVNVADFVI